jgi:mannitol-specific phosphotransferase system IIBC component
MTDGQIKISMLFLAGILAIMFRAGLIGWWGLILAILVAVLGPITLAIFTIRSNRKRTEQELILVATAMMKQSEQRKAENKSTANGA